MGGVGRVGIMECAYCLHGVCQETETTWDRPQWPVLPSSPNDNTASTDEKSDDGPEVVCGICDISNRPRDMVHLQCGHNTYCTTCFRHYVDVHINEVSIRCIEPGCDHEVSYSELRKYMTPEEFGKRNDILAENALAKGNDLAFCPSRCGYYCVRESDAFRAVFLQNLECPKCACQYCLTCQAPWTNGRGQSHSDRTCAEYGKLGCRTAEQVEEDRLSEAKIAETTKECPKCNANIEKNSGCNHMTCKTTGCGHEFCWTCMGSYQTEEWKLLSSIEQTMDFRYPCNPGECYNFPSGTPGEPIVVNGFYGTGHRHEYE